MLDEKNLKTTDNLFVISNYTFQKTYKKVECITKSIKRILTVAHSVFDRYQMLHMHELLQPGLSVFAGTKVAASNNRNVFKFRCSK